jgi:transcriptional regulator with XRE-family HTH domain
MPNVHVRPFPRAAKQLAAFGERLTLARKRRGLSASLMAERIGVSRDTLARLEAGHHAVALGTYLKALRVLGLDRDFDALAQDQQLIQKLAEVNALLARGAPRG